MKRTILSELISGYFRPRANTNSFTGNIVIPPAGMVPDAFAQYGLFGLMANLEAIDWDLIAFVSSSATITMTGAQFFNQIFDHSGSPAGSVAVTTPTAAQIIQACPTTIPGSGYNFPLFYMNDGLGQTVTLTGGTGVTVIGNNTMATNTCRHFMVNVNVNAGTVTLVNYGTMSL